MIFKKHKEEIVITDEEKKKWDIFENTLRVFLRETQNTIITFKNGYSFSSRRIPREELFKDEEVYEVIYYKPNGDKLTRITDGLILANDGMASFTNSVTEEELQNPACVPEILYLRIQEKIDEIEQEKFISENVKKVLKNSEYIKTVDYIEEEL
ncbi:hypothetical protein qdsa002_37 [Staphylococcus phage qdsa002]|uniref:Uncharacterized protein n=2 Tax=Kayvirus G15 TaxID=1924732 RepID=I6PBH4_BPG15|nr:hypothetical protein F360_gp026 [Staphylococcus phage G15]AFF28498.1 hypothetical protein GH15_026 [Staphylococcus phage G15]ARQ95994.1 hypothetical protein qdsa002_37 [Staphylococcus phage qdsa002]